MAIFVETLLNGGNVKQALEDQAILDELDGDSGVDNSTALALAKAKADQSEDPVVTTAQNVLTVSQEFEDELEGAEIARNAVAALEALEVTMSRDKTAVGFAADYQQYQAIRGLMGISPARKVSVEDIDADLEAQRKLALEDISAIKEKLKTFLTGTYERVAKLLTKSGSAVAIAGKEQSIRSKSLLGSLFGGRKWNSEAIVVIPKDGLEKYGEAAANPMEFSAVAVGAIAGLFNGEGSLWNDFVADYLGWIKAGGPADPDRFGRYVVPDKFTAKLPLRPRVENNKVVFDKPKPYSGDGTTKVGDKNAMKTLLSNTKVLANMLANMDKYFGNFDEHYAEIKKNLDAHVEKRSAEDEYFKSRTAEDFREIERRIERAVEFFISLAKYFTEVNKFLLDFATAAVAAAEEA